MPPSSDSVPIIRCALKGNPGNVMFVYLTALKLQQALGMGRIVGVDLPMWNIQISDELQTGKWTIHFDQDMDVVTRGEFPFHSLTNYMQRNLVEQIELEGYFQNTKNLLSASEIDYTQIFDFGATEAVGYGDEFLLISIRGNEVLDAIHEDYTLIPIDFYVDLVEKTGLKPVLFGQLNTSPYLHALQQRLPNVLLHPGKDAAYDFEVIRRSKNIVVSVSTFSWLAAWLSDAEHIFLPLSGLFNPNQHKRTLFIPYGDTRYSYYIFPINYAVPVSSYLTAHEPMNGRWRKVTDTMLHSMFDGPARQPVRFAKYLEAFDADSYVEMYPEQKPNREAHGDTAVFDNFAQRGFLAGRKPVFVDRHWYCRMYPEAAVEIGVNEFQDETHHYVEVGRERGYLPAPPK